jgi:hypothetical protein
MVWMQQAQEQEKQAGLRTRMITMREDVRGDQSWTLDYSLEEGANRAGRSPLYVVYTTLVFAASSCSSVKYVRSYLGFSQSAYKRHNQPILHGKLAERCLQSEASSFTFNSVILCSMVCLNPHPIGQWPKIHIHFHNRGDDVYRTSTRSRR